MKQILYMLVLIMMFFSSSFASSEENKKNLLDLEQKSHHEFTLEPTSHNSTFDNKKIVENIFKNYAGNLLTPNETEKMQNRKRKRQNKQKYLTQEDNEKHTFSLEEHDEEKKQICLTQEEHDEEQRRKKELRKEWNKRYRERHADRIKQYKKIYQDKNADRFREYNEKYRIWNADKMKETKKKYYESHRIEILQYNKNYRECHPEKMKEYNEKNKIQKKEQYEKMKIQNHEQTLQNAFNAKNPDQIINAIMDNYNLKLFMINNKNDPKEKENLNLLLQIVKENPKLQDKIIQHLNNNIYDMLHYSADEVKYIIQLFQTDDTNYGLKYKRSKELFEYLKSISIFLNIWECLAENETFKFYMKKLLMEEDLNAILLHHKWFYLNDQFQSFRKIEVFIEENDKTSIQKYFNILANDPEMEQWIVEIFQTETKHTHKFLFLEVIKKNQVEIAQIILNCFLNYCSKNENFEILIKMLDDPTNKKMPVLPFAIKQKNIKMTKLLIETMLKIPNYELENSNLINVPNAFLKMLIKENSDVEKFLTKTEVDRILEEHDINKILKLLKFPDVVTKWNLIRLCVMMKKRNKVTNIM